MELGQVHRSDCLCLGHVIIQHNHRSSDNFVTAAGAGGQGLPAVHAGVLSYVDFYAVGTQVVFFFSNTSLL